MRREREERLKVHREFEETITRQQEEERRRKQRDAAEKATKEQDERLKKKRELGRNYQAIPRCNDTQKAK